MTSPSPSLHTLTVGEAGSRIVLLHGLFGQGRNWNTVAKGLADRHRVTMVDLPHHGRSPWAESFDYLAIVEQVAALLDPADPVTLVGHSMGGKVAMLTALLHPELVARLVVVDMSPVDYAGALRFSHYTSSLKALDLAAVERREDADRLLAEAIPDGSVRAFLLQNLRREGDSWRWQANLDVLGRDLGVLGGWPEERLTGVAAYDGPVLWVAGEHSDYVQDAYAAAMDRWFPRNRRVTVKGAGHWVHSEQPAVFTEVLRRFAG